MDIDSSYINKEGQEIKLEYRESDPYIGLEGRRLQTVHAFCFCNGKMVLVNHPVFGWQPPGGGIEKGETIEQAIIREVLEETNMKVVFQKIIGFQDVYEPKGIMRQTRSFCIVELCGDFVRDPDGDIQEIISIDPKDYTKYFNWNEVGDYSMQKALEYLSEYSK